MNSGSTGRLVEVSREVLAAGPGVLQVGRDDVDELRDRASQSDLGRARLCAHRDPGDPLHEMLIVLRRDSYIRPHRHPGKSESFHVVEGLVDVVIFEDDGAVSQVVSLGDYASGRSFYYRLSDPLFHTLIIRSEEVVIHEITNGPFRREDTVFAPWAPGDDDGSAAAAFIDRLARRVSSMTRGAG